MRKLAMAISLRLLCVLALVSGCWGQTKTTDPVVVTAQGQLRGSIQKTVGGKDIFSFRGVRFAEPPVGKLRFREPVPISPWSGIRNATEDGNFCPQLGFDGFVKSEDCLFLNVYTKKLSDGRNNPKKPVVVFFHPGGFYGMTGSSKIHGPQYLLDQDIVLVTTNYRLGALGFLSADDPALRGNYGMKDQVQVLRWVKENIASFGGDPDSVTITGYSAGSMSVMLHMLSPMSKGLFHRCIAMSASATRLRKSDHRPQAEKQAALFNCPTDTVQQIVDCLRQKDAQEIAATLGEFREWGGDPISVFLPIVERDYGDGVESFLLDEPEKLFLAGNFTQVPLITGYTTDEFSFKALEVVGNSSLAEDMDQNFERVAPITFGYERDTERSRNISREIRKFYFKDQPINSGTVKELGQLYSDIVINYPEDHAARIISSVSRAPVYFYKFSYAGRFSHVNFPPDFTTPYGVVHHDDLMYLFYISNLFPLFNKSDPEYQTVQKLTKMWSNFAQTGNPIPERSPLLNNVKWEPFTAQNLKYLDIGSTLKMNVGLYQDRMAVWHKLFPIPVSTRKQ